jgi:hypothetical protein
MHEIELLHQDALSSNQEVVCFEHGIFRAFSLIAGNCAYCREDCEVDGTGVVKYAPDHSLDVLHIFVGQRWRLFRREGALDPHCHTVLALGHKGSVANMKGMCACIFGAAFGCAMA